MQLETMKILDDALNCEDYDYEWWFGDLSKGVQYVECELRWDVYDDGAFPVLENVKVVEMLTPEQMESNEKDLQARDQAELYDIPF